MRLIIAMKLIDWLLSVSVTVHALERDSMLRGGRQE